MMRGATINSWAAPRADQLGNTVEEFLQQLDGPTWIEVPGRDRSRCRAVSTLLHGNEPSGVRALFQWLKQENVPAVDMLFFVGAVDAALEPPGFAHRHLPGRRDLNRCFQPPFEGREGAIAAALLEKLHERRPEALIDIHNTSGSGPAFAVAIREDPAHDSLAALFAPRVIITDIRLGALMEFAESQVPTITIECGGAYDEESDKVAVRGLQLYCGLDQLFAVPAVGMDVLHHPLRLELRSGAVVGYGEAPLPGSDLTLPFDVERLNFELTPQGAFIGWLGAGGAEQLRAVDSRGEVTLHPYFSTRGGELRAAVDLRIFMVTTDPDIARSDCVLYFIRA